MQSKNTSLAKNNIQLYVNQILEQNESIQKKLETINDLVDTREQVLTELIDGFESFLKEYELTHPKQITWRKTLRNAKKYIAQRNKGRE